MLLQTVRKSPTVLLQIPYIRPVPVLGWPRINQVTYGGTERPMTTQVTYGGTQDGSVRPLAGDPCHQLGRDAR